MNELESNELRKMVGNKLTVLAMMLNTKMTDKDWEKLAFELEREARDIRTSLKFTPRD